MAPPSSAMVGAMPLGEVGILCHLAVRHDYRKFGLGSALSSWAVSYLRSWGAKVVRLDSTHGAKRLYESLSFEPVSKRSVYRLEGGILAARLRGHGSLDERAARTRGVCVTPLLFGDLPELYGVDRWAFGGDRSALIRATLNLHPGWVLIARDASGRMNGYLVRSAYKSTVRIGTFMASSPDVARVPLAHALQTDSGRYVEVSVPSPAESPAHGVLREFGFVGWWDRLRMESARRPARMVLRSTVPPRTWLRRAFGDSLPEVGESVGHLVARTQCRVLYSSFTALAGLRRRARAGRTPRTPPPSGIP
jgi:Acetyltransferase (GNAT) domain